MSDDRSASLGEPKPRTCRAFAHVRGLEISFRQSGRGQPVIVVGLDSILTRRIEARLGARYTVVVPDAAAVASDDRARLSEFIDCLGLRRAHVVAKGPQSLPATELMLADAERVERIVVLDDEAGGDRPTDTAGGRLLVLTLAREPGPVATEQVMNVLAHFLETGALPEPAAKEPATSTIP
jgi:hypothetical protein